MDLINTFSEWGTTIRPYMAKELKSDITNQGTGGHNIVKTVYIECGWKEPLPGKSKAYNSYGEVVMAQEVADKNPGINNGIIGYVDLTLDDFAGVESVLKDMKENNPNFRGIRFSLSYSDSGIVMNNHHSGKQYASTGKVFRENFKLLEKYDLVYDCWLYHHNIKELTDLALANPNVVIVMDHIGMPTGIETSWENVYNGSSWKKDIENIAKCPNVYCKLSGVGMPTFGFGYEKRRVPAHSKE